MTKITHKKLMTIYTEVADLVLRKNADYKGAWEQDGIVGITVRMKDKLNRMQTLASGQEALVADEKIEDTARDLIGYAALLLIKAKEDAEQRRIQELADVVAIGLIKDMPREVGPANE